MSLWAELRRRNVLKVGAAYLVVAWLLIQVAATVTPQLQLPDWAPRLITLLLMLGFPIALLIAWFLEHTPEGMKVEPVTAGNRRMLIVAAALAALALGWYFRIGQPGPVNTAQQPDEPAGAPRVRLAVLPFANFSPDPANGFFADGLHDDLLTALSRVRDVDVISRTTMHTFKGSPLTLVEIAQKVSATHAIEGSVRREGEQVRLTVQLIDARSDQHQWAQTYDRTLREAQALQRTVAADVAKALGATLPGQVAETPGTTVPAAYDLYLKSRITLDRGDRLKLLDSALLLDPGYSRARAARASIACVSLWFDDLQTAKLAPQARADIDQVRREAPGLPAADIAEAYYIYYVELDYPRALATVDRVLAADPNNAEALAARAPLLRRLGRFDEAIVAARRSAELDPGSIDAIKSLADYLRALGRYRESVAALDQAMETFRSAGADTVMLESARIRTLHDMTGDAAAALAALETLKGRISEQRWLRERSFFSTPQHRLEGLALAPDWISGADRIVYPKAVRVALIADQLGDAALRGQALEEAARHYAAAPPGPAERPGSRAWRALYLALRGDHGKAIEEARRAVAEVTDGSDAVALASVFFPATCALALAGARDQALDVLERRARMPMAMSASNYHDPVLSRLLGGEPRYEAVMQRIASRFEQP